MVSPQEGGRNEIGNPRKKTPHFPSIKYQKSILVSFLARLERQEGSQRKSKEGAAQQLLKNFFGVVFC